MSIVRVDGIEPDLGMLSTHQRFIFGDVAADPLNRLSIDNLFVPTALATSHTLLDLRNGNSFSGFRLRHETAFGETIGKLRIQSFTGGSTSGTDILVFNNDGTFVIPGLTDPKYILQTAVTNLPNAQSLGTLTTGLLKNTVAASTGVLSTAVAGTDYYSLNNPTKIIDTGASPGNLSVGKTALNSLTSGSGNIIIGNTGASLTTGSSNTIIQNSPNNITTGINNTIVGSISGELITTGNTNALFGLAAGREITTGYNNVCLGVSAGYYIGVGNNNVMVGYDAGGAVDYVNCIFIGSGATSPATLTNAVAIGAGATVSANNSMVLGSGLNVGIGTSAPTQAKFVVSGGVTNVASEYSAIRVIGDNNSIKVELQNTTPSTGKLFELRSNSTGTFSIYNRTNTHERLILNTDGSISCNGATSGSAQFIALNNDATSGTSGYVWKTGASTRATFYHSEVNNELILTAITGGMPIIFGTNNLEKMRLNSTGNLGIGENNPTLARLQVFGGVTNVASEESVARFVGGLNAAKIELQCSNGSGKLYELRSDNAGAFGIFDRTGTSSRLSFDTNGILTVFKNVLISTASASDTPYYQVGHNTDLIQLGYDGPNDYSFINVAGSSNDRIAFRFGGTGVAALLQSGLFGIGTITPTQAKLVVSGGVQNIANEDSIIRALSSANVAKIEIQCTNGSGKIYELRVNNSGAFELVDRTAAVSRIFVNTSGQVGIGTNAPNCNLQLTNSTASRKFVIFEAGNNDHQFKGLGHNTEIFRFQTNQTADSFVFFAGTSTTTSDEVARISGVGTFTTSKIQGKTANQPGVAAGSAAGSSPTLSINGGEVSGTLQVTAGTTPSGTLIVTVTLDVAMASANYGVVITPANQATASLATPAWIDVTSSTQFTLNNLTPLVATTVYKWNYHILGV